MIFLWIDSFLKLTCSQNTIGYILNMTFKTICLISFTAALVLQFSPTLVDKTVIMVNYPIEEKVTDKSKYELSVITNNNEKYLKFDNKSNDNIQLRNNNKKVNTDIFKIVAENDNEYLLEYEVVDKGFFSDTVKQERSSLTKK